MHSDITRANVFFLSLSLQGINAHSECDEEESTQRVRKRERTKAWCREEREKFERGEDNSYFCSCASTERS